MHEVRLKDTTYVYLESVAELPLAAQRYEFCYGRTTPPPARVLEAIAGLAYVRPVLVEYARLGSRLENDPSQRGPLRIMYFVRWPIERDLTALDAKVAEGRADAADFADAIFTSHLAANCRGCGATWHVLTMDIDFIPGRGAQQGEQRRRVHSYQCPGCGSSLRNIVTDILGPA